MNYYLHLAIMGYLLISEFNYKRGSRLIVLFEKRKQFIKAFFLKNNYLLFINTQR